MPALPSIHEWLPSGAVMSFGLFLLLRGGMKTMEERQQENMREMRAEQREDNKALSEMKSWIAWWRASLPSGSPRVRTHKQKMTVAARRTAERKMWAQRSVRVAIRRQSLSRANRFST